MENKSKILVVLTGGTICSHVGRNGKSKSNATKTKSYLAEHFQKSDSPFASQAVFDYCALETDVLSENMSASVLYGLLGIFKNHHIEEKYAGVIVLHGTDTLAYTSSFLSFALAGFALPVCMVSAQLPLKRKRKTEENGRIKAVVEDDPDTNGYANFRASVELILNGIAPNVYVVYRNMDGTLLLHLGAHLLQCPNGSDDFHSRDEMKIPDQKNARLAGISFENAHAYLHRVTNASENVLFLTPHTNLNYSLFDLTSCRAVIHGTYHSESVCIGRPSDASKKQKKEYLTLDTVREEDRPFSILLLLSLCKEKKIPLFLAPCQKKNFKYSTTANALRCGAIPLPCLTAESAYAKALLACMLGKSGRAFELFMQKSLNHEFEAFLSDE